MNNPVTSVRIAHHPVTGEVVQISDPPAVAVATEHVPTSRPTSEVLSGGVASAWRNEDGSIEAVTTRAEAYSTADGELVTGVQSLADARGVPLPLDRLGPSTVGTFLVDGVPQRMSLGTALALGVAKRSASGGYEDAAPQVADTSHAQPASPQAQPVALSPEHVELVNSIEGMSQGAMVQIAGEVVSEDGISLRTLETIAARTGQSVEDVKASVAAVQDELEQASMRAIAGAGVHPHDLWALGDSDPVAHDRLIAACANLVATQDTSGFVALAREMAPRIPATAEQAEHVGLNVDRAAGTVTYSDGTTRLLSALSLADVISATKDVEGIVSRSAHARRQ